MRFKREKYWLPTLGDKYDFVNFGVMFFVWLKEKRVTNFKEFYRLCGSESIHFEEVLQSGQVSTQDICNYTKESYDGSMLGETTVELLKGKQPTYRYGDK